METHEIKDDMKPVFLGKAGATSMNRQDTHT